MKLDAPNQATFIQKWKTKWDSPIGMGKTSLASPAAVFIVLEARNSSDPYLGSLGVFRAVVWSLVFVEDHWRGSSPVARSNPGQKRTLAASIGPLEIAISL